MARVEGEEIFFSERYLRRLEAFAVRDVVKDVVTFGLTDVDGVRGVRGVRGGGGGEEE